METRMEPVQHGHGRRLWHAPTQPGVEWLGGDVCRQRQTSFRGSGVIGEVRRRGAAAPGWIEFEIARPRTGR